MSKSFYLLHGLFWGLLFLLVLSDLSREFKLHVFFLTFSVYLVFIAAALMKLCFFLLSNFFLKDASQLSFFFIISLVTSSAVLFLLTYFISYLLNANFPQEVNLKILHYTTFHVGSLGTLYQTLRYAVFLKKKLPENSFFSKKRHDFLPITLINEEKIDLPTRDVLYVVKKKEETFIFTRDYAYRVESQELLESLPFWLFSQISKSHFVRASQIKKVFKRDGEIFLKTSDHSEFPVESGYLQEITMKSLYK